METTFMISVGVGGPHSRGPQKNPRRLLTASLGGVYLQCSPRPDVFIDSEKDPVWRGT